MSVFDLQTAVSQVRAHVGVAMLADLSVLQVSGPDAPQFLQNRLTNDVLALQPGQGQLNAVLDRQAKIQGVFGLYRCASGFWLLIDKAEQVHAVAQILKFRIVEQVQIADLYPAVSVFSVQGPESAAFMTSFLNGATLASEIPVQEHGWIAVNLPEAFGAGHAWVIRRSLSGEAGFLLIAETDSPLVIWAALQEAAQAVGGVMMTTEVQECLRIEAGLPRFEADYDFETLLPETGLERLAVSYTKGCYLGQETVARVKTYGMVQQALVGLLFEADAFPFGITGVAMPTPCLLDGKPVGKLTSIVLSPTLARPIALAYLGKTERIPGKRLTLEIAGQLYPVEVSLLPFYDAQIQHTGQSLLDAGLKHFAEGYDEEAIRVLKQAIACQPELVPAYEALGVILSRHDRYPEAISMMEQVLSLQPDHVLAHTNLSVFYMKLGDKEKAEEEKAKATMAAFSQKAKAAGLVFDIEAQRQKKEAATLAKIDMFMEALKFNPADPLGNFGLGSAYLELKRFAEALEPLQKVLQAQPKHSVAYLSLGKALEGLHDTEGATQTYQTGIEVAAAKGDLMPLKEMQTRLANLTPAIRLP